MSRRAYLPVEDQGFLDSVRDAYATSIGALLREPTRAPIEIALPPNQTRTLVLRQTGQTDFRFCSIHQLALWDR